MKPICLITPPSAFLMDERVFVSLGVLKVAAALERAGYPVEHLDLSGVANYEAAVCDHAAQSDAQVYGLTATTPQMPAAVKIANVIRDAHPHARIILGGPHITLVNAARKREERMGIPSGRALHAFCGLEALFDVLVAGDGEVAIFEALRPSSPMLIDGDDPKSPLFLTNETLNASAFPARHLVDMDSYHYTIDGEPAHSMIAQLGCPFGCGFCGGRESPMLRRIRTRSTQMVVAEIVHLYQRYGVRGVMMYDDELNVNPQMIPMMDAIADAGAGLGVEWRLRGFVKAQLFTQAQADAMYRAGFRWILVGFESGSPRILENINKRATRDENSRCMAYARAAGLKVKALMSIGHPGESAGTIAETRAWLLAERPDDFDVTIISTYPGTPYYDHAEPYGDGSWVYTCPKSRDRLYSEDVDYTHTADYYKGAPGEYVSHVWTDYVSAEQLVAARDGIEADVRAALGIPYPSGAAAVRYEHSMGQGGRLPENILRVSA